MTHKENYIIQEFINGTLNKESRSTISKEIKDLNNSKREKMTENNSEKFNADAAWKILHNKMTENKKRNKSFYKMADSTCKCNFFIYKFIK